MTLNSFNEEFFVGEEKLYTFDFETGTFASEVILLSEAESSDFITDTLMLNGGEGEQFAIHLFTQGWFVVDPATGEQTAMTGLPILMSQDSGEGVSMMADTDENFNFSWQLIGVDTLRLDAYPPNRIALSPDGTEIAYADSTLHIWSDGTIF